MIITCILNVHQKRYSLLISSFHLPFYYVTMACIESMIIPG
jgi:hypothetical protein